VGLSHCHCQLPPGSQNYPQLNSKLISNWHLAIGTWQSLPAPHNCYASDCQPLLIDETQHCLKLTRFQGRGAISRRRRCMTFSLGMERRATILSRAYLAQRFKAPRRSAAGALGVWTQPATRGRRQVCSRRKGEQQNRRVSWSRGNKRQQQSGSESTVPLANHPRLCPGMKLALWQTAKRVGTAPW
jgi:hypothetical protein